MQLPKQSLSLYSVSPGHNQIIRVLPLLVITPR